MIATIAVLLQTAPEGPDIIPDPNGEPRPSNVAGLVVAAVLLVGWLLVGLLLYRRGRRRP